VQLIILAAGTGSRLGSLTKKKPKSLIKIKNTCIVDYQLNQFKNLKVKKIIVVVGFASKLIKKKLGKKLKYIVNKKYRSTNNIYSLWLARKFLKEETIITFSDLVMDKNISKKLIKSKKNFTLAIDTSKILNGTMKIKVKNKKLLAIGKSVQNNADGNFIGAAKIKKSKIKQFRAYLNKIVLSKKKDYYTEVFNYLIAKKNTINFIDVKNSFWAEVDDHHDLKKLNKKIQSAKIYKSIT